MSRSSGEPTRREIAKAMREQPANRWWYALRTRSQRNSYEVATDVVERQIPALMERAGTYREGGGTLTPIRQCRYRSIWRLTTSIC